jgi:prokaryotic ubiquitin-like protein Pup
MGADHGDIRRPWRDPPRETQTVVDDNTRGGAVAEQVNGTQRRQSRAKQEAAESIITDGQRTDEELKSEIDALLDEIDAVLESNAVEFLASYTQKSGE